MRRQGLSARSREDEAGERLLPLKREKPLGESSSSFPFSGASRLGYVKMSENWQLRKEQDDCESYGGSKSTGQHPSWQWRHGDAGGR